MRLYITSAGRSEKQLTFRRLSESCKEKCLIVVYKSEESEYKSKGFPTLAYPGPIGLSAKRQWVVGWHNRHFSNPYIALLDDDLDFQQRRSDMPKRAKVATPAQIEFAFEMLETALRSGYAHAGFLQRNQGASPFFFTRGFVYNCRMIDVLAYNAHVLEALGVRFDRIPCMSDFDVTLQLLRLGYQNAVYCRLLQGQPSKGLRFLLPGKKGIGGCSVYRTPEMQRRSAYTLAKLHPGFVKVIEKETSMTWGGGIRTDVRIAWKQAYQSSRRGG